MWLSHGMHFKWNSRQVFDRRKDYVKVTLGNIFSGDVAARFRSPRLLTSVDRYEMP